jgi:hypothetical protein
LAYYELASCVTVASKHHLMHCFINLSVFHLPCVRQVGIHRNSDVFSTFG